MFKIKILRGSRGMVYFTLVCVFAIGLLESLGVPHFITYIYDVNAFLMILLLLNRKKITVFLSNKLIVFQLIFLGTSILTSLANRVSIPLIAWGIRNNCKYIIFFAVCITALVEEDIKAICDIFDVIEVINFLLVIIEYYVGGFAGDNLGGIFGVGDGVTGIVNCFIVIQTISHFIRWMKKEIKTRQLLLPLFMSLVIAVLSELKFYFVEIIIIFVLYFIISCIVEHKLITLLKFVAIGIVVIVSIYIAIEQLYELYPEWRKFFTLENIIYQSIKIEGYTNQGDLNRLSGIITINEKLFKGNIMKQLFGLGLGATEFVEGNATLTSDFYNKYEYLHYSYFSFSWVYLESGIVGLAFYVLSYIMIFIDCLKKRFSVTDKNITYITMILAVFVLSWLYVFLSFLYVQKRYFFEN